MAAFNHLWSFMKKSATAAIVGVTVADKLGTLAFMNGPSMEPALQSGSPDTFGFLRKDVLLVETFFAKSYKYSRGDVIILRSPEDPNEVLVKRLIALQGDWLNVPGSYEILQVPRGRCWVEGDNANLSLDSKIYGPVPLGLIKGRVTHRLWPPDRIGRVERVVPTGRVISSWK